MSATAFSPSYFDRHFLRLLGLKVFSINHESLDKINQFDQAHCVVKDGLKIKRICGLTDRNSLRNTINNHFGGLSNLRTVPIWKLHIDAAMAIFNNRLLVLKEDGVRKNVTSSSDALHILMAELFALDHEVPQVNMARMGMIYRAEQSRVNSKYKIEEYKIACSLLPRIPALNTEEVKQLYAFILEWMVNECNKECDKLGRLDVETIIAMFNNNYNYNTVDLGPADEALGNIEMQDETLDKLYEVWETIDTDLPVLHKDVAKYTRQSSANGQNKPVKKRKRSIFSSQRRHRKSLAQQQIKNEVKEEEEEKEDLSKTPVDLEASSSPKSLRSRVQTRRNLRSGDDFSLRAREPSATTLSLRRQSRSQTKILTNLPKVVIDPLPPALLRSNDFIKSCKKFYSTRQQESLKRKSESIVEEDRAGKRTKRVCRTRSSSCTKSPDQSLSKSLPILRLSKISVHPDSPETNVGLTSYCDEKDVELSEKELIKPINPTSLHAVKDNTFNERSKKIEEKEQILEKRHHLLLKIKVELDDKEKRQDEREKTQNERIKSQNEREKMLNEREKGLDNRDRAQNEREKLQNERERDLEEKNNVIHKQILNFLELKTQENTKHISEKSDKTDKLNEVREARNVNGAMEESSDADEDDEYVNLKAGDMAILLESMIKKHLKKTKLVKKGKQDQRKIHQQ